MQLTKLKTIANSSLNQYSSESIEILHKNIKGEAKNCEIFFVLILPSMGNVLDDQSIVVHTAIYSLDTCWIHIVSYSNTNFYSNSIKYIILMKILDFGQQKQEKIQKHGMIWYFLELFFIFCYYYSFRFYTFCMCCWPYCFTFFLQWAINLSVIRWIFLLTCLMNVKHNFIISTH